MSKHFEQLWEEAEAAAKASFQDLSIQEVAQNIGQLLVLYQDIDLRTSSGEINKSTAISAKSKLVGDILYNLSFISVTDNLNVFDSLNQSIKILK